MISQDTTLILSQDYELFFHESGTIEQCLFEPCAALLRSARRHGYQITFYVDAGMLVRMQSFAATHRRLSREFDSIRRHLTEIADAGHDIGLHIHPHWEDSGYTDQGWDFTNTRYRLEEFPVQEAADITIRYARALGEAAGTAPKSYRAGGFCVEPFDRVGAPLLQVGIDVDSSVVPGAYLKDPVKGFDFRKVAAHDWWRFEHSPSTESAHGCFLEIPVTPQELPFWYYWERLFRKFGRKTEPRVFGDGAAKRIGTVEVLRRLFGQSRVAEMSMDDPKVRELPRLVRRLPARRLCHVMGHPKNLSRNSLELMEKTLTAEGVSKFASVATAARLIRAGGSL
ncbi:MAG: hypothetical protein ACREQ1_14180 [Woeseiaceae bacterium]